MGGQSRIHARLAEILRDNAMPMSARMIKNQAQVIWDVDVIDLALRAMERNGVIRALHAGRYAHKGYDVRAVKALPHQQQADNGKEAAARAVAEVSKSITVASATKTANPEEKSSPVKKKAVAKKAAVETRATPDPLHEELLSMSKKLSASLAIDDLASKLTVLETLRDYATPAVAKVLDAVVDDYKRFGCA